MAGEKSFAPTATRIRKAREEGNRPSTGDAAGLCATLVAMCAVAAQAEHAAVSLRSFWRGALFAASDNAAHGMLAALPPAALCAAIFLEAARIVAIVCGAYAITSIGLTYLLGGGGYSRLRFDVKKCNPATNAKRLFSTTSIFAAMRGLAATAIIGAVLVRNLPDAALATAGAGTPAAMFLAAQYYGTRVFATAGALGLLFVFLEWRLSVLSWLKKLRMDFAEIKREYREQNGDPHQKNHRRRFARRMQRSRRIALRRATVVVVNPTHIAVALFYRPPEDAVPLVIAKGADFAAQRIREEARAAGVPIVESIATARALFAQAEEGEPIPIELYGAVAPIIAGILQA